MRANSLIKSLPTMANVTDDKRISHQVDGADAQDLFLPEIMRRPQLFFTFRASRECCKTCLCNLHIALWRIETCADAHDRNGSKCDMAASPRHFRSSPQSRLSLTRLACQLRANSCILHPRKTGALSGSILVVSNPRHDHSGMAIV